MPILKTDILGSQIEINYEKNEYKRLLKLIDNFKNRLNEFPNNGRISNNAIMLLSALKAEDQLDEVNKILEVKQLENKKIEEKQLMIENLNFQIVSQKNQIKELTSEKLSESKSNDSISRELYKMEGDIERIQKKIKNLF